MLNRWLMILIACPVLLTSCNGSTSNAAKTEIITIRGEAFTLELAIDHETRQRGLMNREDISDSGGMLFVFPDDQVGIQRFWMGYCLVDMDIIFLDPSGRVTATHRMKTGPPRGEDENETEYDARMPRYSSGYPAQFAIELKAGSLDRLQLKVDERIDLDFKRLKAMAR
jgi:uncharacterized protein